MQNWGNSLNKNIVFRDAPGCNVVVKCSNTFVYLQRETFRQTNPYSFEMKLTHNVTIVFNSSLVWFYNNFFNWWNSPIFYFFLKIFDGFVFCCVQLGSPELEFITFYMYFLVDFRKLDMQIFLTHKPPKSYIKVCP